MIDIFNNVFTESHFIKLEENNKDEFTIKHILGFEKNKAICISQNHDGKRIAMFTAFSTSLIEKNRYNKNIKYVFCTDSYIQNALKI